MFDAIKFFEDYHIDYVTHGSRARPGWVQVHCPFCGGSQRGYDLGFNLEQGYFTCWQCRGKHIYNAIKNLAGISYEEAKRVYVLYSGRPTLYKQRTTPSEAQILQLPPTCGPLLEVHENYLVKRRFDPERLVSEFGLMGTGHLGDYKFRIIAPVYFGGKLISYLGRAISKTAALRYMVCGVEKEVMHHKHTLYHIDKAAGDSIAVVEGITDVWRLGPGAGGLFGTGYKTEQLALIAKRYKNVFMVLDPEPAALKIADEMGYALGMLGCNFYIVELDGGVDPGDMKQDDADALMRELKLRGWNNG